MTQALAPNEPEVRDFTHRIKVRFRIDDDVFNGVPGIPAFNLMEFGVLFDGLSEREIMKQPDTFARMIDLVLTDESAALFKSRMADKVNPISLPQIQDVLPYLMERYGLRPTPPSAGSSDGSENPADGTSSMDLQPANALTPSGFQPIDS